MVFEFCKAKGLCDLFVKTKQGCIKHYCHREYVLIYLYTDVNHELMKEVRVESKLEQYKDDMELHTALFTLG